MSHVTQDTNTSTRNAGYKHIHTWHSTKHIRMQHRTNTHLHITQDKNASTCKTGQKHIHMQHKTKTYPHGTQDKNISTRNTEHKHIHIWYRTKTQLSKISLCVGVMMWVDVNDSACLRAWLIVAGIKQMHPHVTQGKNTTLKHILMCWGDKAGRCKWQCVSAGVVNYCRSQASASTRNTEQKHIHT